MFLAVDYFDELYYLSRHIQQYKEKNYKENREAFSSERYVELCDKIDFLLTSSRVHARVALTYGEKSKELDSFNKLRTNLTDAALLLFRAKAETWDDTSKKVMGLFEKKIDPLRKNTEIDLIRGTKLKAVLCSMVCFRKCDKPRVPESN